MKRKLAWVCLLVSPLVLGGAAFCFADRDPITQANCDRIKKGMTEEEVEAILGNRWSSNWWSKVWKGSHGQIFVSFGSPFSDYVTPQPYVRNVWFVEDPHTILDKFRHWLGVML